MTGGSPWGIVTIDDLVQHAGEIYVSSNTRYVVIRYIVMR